MSVTEEIQQELQKSEVVVRDLEIELRKAVVDRANLRNSLHCDHNFILDSTSRFAFRYCSKCKYACGI